MAESPLVIKSGKKNIITFEFEKLPFFLQEAEYYVREHITSMYPVLPTMQGTDNVLLKEAIEELAALYGYDEVSLIEQSVCMELLLERTGSIALPERP